MVQRKFWVAAALLLSTAGIGAGAVVHASQQDGGGYLASGEFDLLAALKSAPKAGEPAYERDRQIFRDTRKLENSPRWALAKADVDASVPAMMEAFSCAMGVQLSPEKTPAMLKIIHRVSMDVLSQSGPAKDVFKRARPFTIDKGAVCQPEAELLDRKTGAVSYDFPSGHATWGASWGLVLSAIAPDRAAQINARSRAFAESRIVCGVHNESSVVASVGSAEAGMKLIAAKPAFQSDLAAAQAEYAALRKQPIDGASCAANAALIEKSVLPPR